MLKEEYGRWLDRAVADPDVAAELKAMAGNEDEIKECFWQDLEFGTGGLRGVIGAGTNRLNIYTIGKATQGLAAYVNSTNKNGSVAIAYDSRIKSDLFARTAAGVLAANGIRVYIYRELMPTPMLSYAVRRLGCDAGIVITASHNPSKYNGYKVYGPDGCQLGLEAAEYVLNIMNSVDVFDGVKHADFDAEMKKGNIEYISDEVIDDYLSCVEKQRVEKDLDLSGLKVIYTPLHGTGNKPVRRILERVGVTDVTVVPEQEKPDGTFPTVPFPNPEFRQAFERALELAKTVKPDLLLATDPDCDRVGIAVRRGDEYILMTGNEVGAMLLDYIAGRRKANGTLPRDPVAVKTIVTTDLAARIAEKHGVRLIDVLTGFKFIGEQIAILEKDGEEDRYIFGFEESYGYLAGSYVRDKDGVVASMLICEMAAYCKTQGKSLLDYADDLYAEHGYYLCSQKNFYCEGISGMEQINGIMDKLRGDHPAEIAGIRVVRVKDYKLSCAVDLRTGEKSVLTLPKSNVLGFDLEDGGSVIVRPSGTEPKIKIYLSAVGRDKGDADAKREALEAAGTAMLGF
ncbi:MAG: phospho-sugar mutase [Clostridia bacterium]|nr:phospho-sugar mutase [Clostridia bacterium]